MSNCEIEANELRRKVMHYRAEASQERNERALVLAELQDAVDALRAMKTMQDRGPCPKKFDEALSWRENDELARQLADAAIASYDAKHPEGK